MGVRLPVHTQPAQGEQRPAAVEMELSKPCPTGTRYSVQGRLSGSVRPCTGTYRFVRIRDADQKADLWSGGLGLGPSGVKVTGLPRGL